MAHTKKLILFILLLYAKMASGQDIPGYNSSNYAGVSGIDLQPASIADMRYAVDINLIGGGMGFNNNYIGFNSKSVLNGNIFKNTSGDFKQQFLFENTTQQDKAASLYGYIQWPSVAVSLSKNISIGFTWRTRFVANVDNLSPELAHLIYTGLDPHDSKNLTYFNVKLNNDQFNMNEMAWTEYGFDYAQVITGKGPHFLKVGGRIKFEEGLEAAYIYAQNLSYAWKNKDTLSLFNSHFSYGQTQNISQLFAQNRDIPTLLQNVSSSSVAFDIGVVYEWRTGRQTCSVGIKTNTK
jgi:hypothetical protein